MGEQEEEPEQPEAKSGGAAVPLPAQAKVARKSQGRGDKTES